MVGLLLNEYVILQIDHKYYLTLVALAEQNAFGVNKCQYIMCL